MLFGSSEAGAGGDTDRGVEIRRIRRRVLDVVVGNVCEGGGEEHMISSTTNFTSQEGNGMNFFTTS